jgi:hypothetical protein
MMTLRGRVFGRQTDSHADLKTIGFPLVPKLCLGPGAFGFSSTVENKNPYEPRLRAAC